MFAFILIGDRWEEGPLPLEAGGAWRGEGAELNPPCLSQGYLHQGLGTDQIASLVLLVFKNLNLEIMKILIFIFRRQFGTTQL